MMAFIKKRTRLLRFRTKLIIVLLCLSLGPIIIMRTGGMGAMRRMVEKFVPQAREYLISSHEDRLRSVVQHYAYSTMMGGEAIEMIMQLQAQVVQRTLAGNPPGKNDPLFTEDYYDANPSEQKKSGKQFLEYYHLNRRGDKKPLKVDFNASGLFLSGEPLGRGVEKDRKLLQGLDASLVRLSRYTRQFAIWQITALENGLVSVYPKVDHLPPHYDPRERSWYRRSLTGNKMYWSLSSIDPITRRSVINLSIPVKRPDGSLAGVTSLVVPVNVILERDDVLDQVPPSTKMIMGSYGSCDDCPETPTEFVDSGEHELSSSQAIIVATQKREDGYRWNWRRQQKQKLLNSIHDIPFKAMLMDLKAGRSGSQRMEFEGKDSLWFYGPMGGPTFTLLITPYSEVLGPVNRVENQVVSQISDLMQIVLAIGLVVMIVVVVVAFLFSRTVTKPINQLAEGSRRLGEGDFEARVEIKTCDEFMQIGKAFNDLGPRLKENYQLRQALALAMEVQQRLLPQSQPKIPGLDIFGKSVYCDETGGDYYDFITSAPVQGRGHLCGGG
jgi:sigma-B regulation protein RsbU (phosphoserine phosphatase)